MLAGASVALLFAGFETSIGNAQETPAAVKAGWRVDPVVKNPFRRLKKYTTIRLPAERFGLLQRVFAENIGFLLGSRKLSVR